MKIVFFPVECGSFHKKTLEERPLGGIETGVIRLSEALASLDQDVFVVTQEEESFDSQPFYISPQRANHLGQVDAVIIVRGWKGAFLPFDSKKRYYWTGDAWDNSHTFGIGDHRFIKKIDALFPVSKWHAETLCASSGFPYDKTFILRNGIYLPYFSTDEKRHRKRLIYSSTPGRGLKHLPSIFLELKQRHADLELFVYSSFDRYSLNWPPIFYGDNPYEELFNTLSKIPGCHLEGSIPQSHLAKEFMRASILAYPSDFEETSCITVMEAQAAGCAIVTSDLAALRETVGEAGILIPGEAGSLSYRKQFVEACDLLLSDDTYFEKISAIGKKQALTYDWKIRAKELLSYLEV